jgi:hypothetical protein
VILEMQTKETVGIQTNQAVGIKSNEKAGLEMQKAVSGLRLVHVSRRIQATELREATTGRPVAVPRIWAVAERGRVSAQPAPAAAMQEVITEAKPASPKVELAFYRKYTEALLRRYLRLSTQVGRTPSLMGRELFRGSASHYTMTTFEDEVVFCVDVERCVARLQKDEQRFIRRIALQGYTLQEAAPLLGLDFRRCHERYNSALDQLTEIFLAGRILEPLKSCQDVETV